MTTHRDEGVGTEVLQRWLGNLRRLPGTQEMVLTRLDQDATADQIEATWLSAATQVLRNADPPHPSKRYGFARAIGA